MTVPSSSILVENFEANGNRSKFMEKLKLHSIEMYVCIVTLGDYNGPKNHQKIIVIGQIIGSGKIDSFM